MKIKFLSALLSAMFATTQIASAEFHELNLDDGIDLALKNSRMIEQSVELRENDKWLLKSQRRATGTSLSWSDAVNKIGGNDYVTRRGASNSNYNQTFDNTLRLSYLIKKSSSIFKIAQITCLKIVPTEFPLCTLLKKPKRILPLLKLTVCRK